MPPDIDHEDLPGHIERVRAFLRDVGADALLASDVGSVRWLTGRSADIEHGPATWNLGTHALITRDDGVIVCPHEELHRAPPPLEMQVITYEAFTLRAELTPHRWAAEALASAIRTAELTETAIVAIESAALPAALLAVLGDRRTVTVDAELRRMRAVKDASEIELIRAAAQLTDAGQRAFREHLAPGVSEVALWSRVHAEMERVAGERVPVLADLMFGERCLLIGVPPTAAPLAPGDLALCDLVARRNGYWSDSCTTRATGRPSAGARRIHAAALTALDLGVRAARPGITGGELDDIVRGCMREGGYEYPLHTGHGVGTTGHEEPRIVPGASTTLEAGMVIALEPGAYSGEDGVRVEHLLVVTEQGGELLTSHALDLT